MPIWGFLGSNDDGDTYYVSQDESDIPDDCVAVPLYDEPHTDTLHLLERHGAKIIIFIMLIISIIIIVA